VKNRILICIGLLFSILVISCEEKRSNEKEPIKIPIIFDTDANNELDDQHALAYLLFNSKTFDVKGITTNATYNGGNIDEHNQEAERVMKLSKAENKTFLLKGANANFIAIEDSLHLAKYDGYKAINFMITEAHKATKSDKLVLLAVGKLTNVALAVKKDPSIINKVRLVWLGSNYPEQGEYNLDNDIPAMNYLLSTSIIFEMVTVRYNKSTGTDAVKIYKNEVLKMKGLGPHIETPIIGRHGKKHSNFGDYAISLFKHTHYYGDPPARSLFDMAAVAIVKNPDWAIKTEIPSPIMVENKWVDQPDNTRKIFLWENFDKEKIMTDFYNSLKNYELLE